MVIPSTLELIFQQSNGTIIPIKFPKEQEIELPIDIKLKLKQKQDELSKETELSADLSATE